MVELSNLGLDEVGSNPTYHKFYSINAPLGSLRGGEDTGDRET